MSQIHPTAIVDSGAEIDADVFIGPYCVVGPGVRLAGAVHLESHVVVTGETPLVRTPGCSPLPRSGTDRRI